MAVSEDAERSDTELRTEARWLDQQIAGAAQVFADPTASDEDIRAAAHRVLGWAERRKVVRTELRRRERGCGR